MLNGLAQRNGFEAAPKVRKNRIKCSATTAPQMIDHRMTGYLRPESEVTGNPVFQAFIMLFESAAELPNYLSALRPAASRGAWP
jgi:hypothetical protein